MAAASDNTGETSYGPKDTSPNTNRGEPTVIDVSPDGQNIVYCNSTNVIVRDVDDPSKTFCYGEHKATVKVAKFSPSGKYVASGDAEGNVRVWAWTHPENLLKNESNAFAGEVEDICWDGESKRILAVGGGQMKGKLFMWDSGSQLGEIIPHSKKNLSGSIRPVRPFRFAMGGLDFKVTFYSCPPAKYQKGLSEHTNFVNCIRYSPCGSKFVSVSSDKTGIIYEGKDAEILGKLGGKTAHKGSVYAASWKPDSTAVVTSGADKKLNVWNAESLQLDKSITLGTDVGHMQPGVVWVRDQLIASLSLNGRLNFWDPSKDEVSSFLDGHVSPVNYTTCTGDGHIITGDIDGRLCVWKPVENASGQYVGSIVGGETHTGKITGIFSDGKTLSSVGWDDKLRIGTLEVFEHVVPIGGQPRGLASSSACPDIRVIATNGALKVFKGTEEACSVEVDWAPIVVEMDSSGKMLVAGGEDCRLHLYAVDGNGSLSELGQTKPCNAAISSVAISPDGKYIAAGDRGREVKLYSAVSPYETVRSGDWMNHATRVTGLAWSPLGNYLCSVSSDRRICFWSPDSVSAVKCVDLAHPQPLIAVLWKEEGAVWVTGADGIVKRFEAPI